MIYGSFNDTVASQYVKINGDLYLSSDNRKIHLGTDNDAEIFYNGTNLVLSPRVVGSGGVTIGVGAADVNYSLIFDGDDNDGTITWDEANAVFGFDSAVDVGGTLRLHADNRVLFFGGSEDAALYYDSANFVIDPRSTGTGIVKVNGDIWPATDDAYYLGSNDDDVAFAWKGIILKDQGGTGKYYRLEVNGDALQIVDLTD